MGWFRKDRDGAPDAVPGDVPGDVPGGPTPTGGGSGPLVTDPDAPTRPVEAPLGDEERARIERALADLAAAGVDVDDLASLEAGLDAAFSAWEAEPEASRGDHGQIVERFALGIGEHLHRHTDLRWAVVTDAFGTDLAVSGSGRKEFVVVPHNLVAVRWLRRERGWVRPVVGHIVRLRNDR